MNAAYPATKGLSSYMPLRGASEEARKTQGRVAAVLDELYNTESLGVPVKETLDRLDEAFEECTDVDWDGYGSPPAKVGSYLEAKRFLKALPSGVPIPEITIEPDGDVGLEWYCRRGQVFVVSISGDGTLTYAGKFGRSKTHGTAYFYDEIPRLVLTSLRTLLG